MHDQPLAARRSRALRGAPTPFVFCCFIAAGVVSASAYWQGMPDPDHYRIYAEKYAAAFFDGGPLPDAFRPPFYPIVLSPIVQFAPSPLVWIAVLHAILVVSIVAAVLRIARLGLANSATIACLLVAVDPILAFQSGQIMTELLFTALLIWAIQPWLRDQPKSSATTATSGLLIGLAFLTRPTMAPIFAAVGFSLLIRRRFGDFRAWLTAALVAFAIALPWAIRNKVTEGELLFTTTHGGYTLWLANNSSFHGVEVIGGRNWAASDEFEHWQSNNQRLTTGTDGISRDWRFRELALEWIRSNPEAAARSAGYRLLMFWGLKPRSGPEVLRPVIGVFFGVLFVLAAIGWFVTRSWQGPWLTATLVVVALSLVHTIYWSNMRFRAPIEPLLAIWAAAGVEWIVRRTRPATNDI
jgi:uncharacterized membrane protein